MPPTKHAVCSPSSAKQWMACPPSVRWCETLPDPPERDYTREGTLAHSLAEAKLSGGVEDWREHNEYDPLYDAEMERATDEYAQRVRDTLAQYELAGKHPHLYLEVPLDLTQWIPEAFGTSDAVIVADGILHVIDLKYGKGVPVDAEGNPQLRIYALGAYNAFRVLEDFETVTTEIIQPRLDSDTTETMTLESLLVWAHDVLAPCAELAFKGEGEFHPTEGGCRFCKGRHLCRYNAAKQLELGRIDHARGPELTVLEIAGILERVEGLTKWANSMKEWALEQALEGVDFPGWKLVEGRSVRTITDEKEAIAKLTEAGFDPKQVTKLVGMTELEKLVGKKPLAELLSGIIVKPEGKPVLAKETDKRPALVRDSASEYFKD